MAELTLKKPIKIDGEEKSVIEYDLDELTGAEIQQATTELQNLGIMVATAEFDMNYHAALFAKAAGMAYADVQRFSAKDYTKVSTLVRNFLLSDLAE